MIDSVIGHLSGLLIKQRYKGGIFVVCGCWSGMIDDFHERVKQVHGDSIHGRAYQAAIQMAKDVINQTPASQEVSS